MIALTVSFKSSCTDTQKCHLKRLLLKVSHALQYMLSFIKLLVLLRNIKNLEMKQVRVFSGKHQVKCFPLPSRLAYFALILQPHQ